MRWAWIGRVRASIAETGMKDTLIPDRWHGLGWRDLLVFGLPALLILALGFYGASRFIRPPTPSHIAISTGGDTDDYFAFAQNYARILAQNGITLEVRPSPGSTENLARLLDTHSDVSIAFLRSGLNHPPVEGEKDPAATLAKLATIAYEPLWVFYRHPRPLDHLAQLKGKRLAVGPVESETYRLAAPLLETHGLNHRQTRQWPVEGQAAAEALEAGRIDAAFIIASADEPIVRRLLMNPQIRLMSLAHAEALVRRFPILARPMPAGASSTREGSFHRHMRVIFHSPLRQSRISRTVCPTCSAIFPSGSPIDWSVFGC